MNKFSQWWFNSSLLVADEPGKLTVNEMEGPQALTCYNSGLDSIPV
jgi:hypothetical protein